MANSAENILTLINTRVETAAARQFWPASGRLARRSWTDSVAMTLGILATTSATPADDRAAVLPSDPGRRRDDGRFEAPGTSQTAGRLVQTGTSPRRPAARHSRTRGDWRPSSGARRPTTSGPRGVRLINNLTLGTKPAPEHAPTRDAAPRRRAPIYETKRRPVSSNRVSLTV